jgi:two-component system OmpR family response regulator
MTSLQRVLLVDDEPDIRRIGELSLKRVGGFEVALAGSGLEAVQLAESFRPQLILLDVMMPGMDGLQTFARLREHPALSQTPVIFVTAKVQREEVAHLRALGAIGVVAKPFNPMTLAGEVRAIFLGAPR